ncbi:sialidase family protein, partial [Brevibacillus centrosporus]|nr:sialidase family protein [Brevibacillus centrosporus]
MAATTVVNAAYDTSGNGGRKLVRLSNGWLIAGAYDSTNKQVNLYKSTDNGATWARLCFMSDGSYGSVGFSMAARGTNVYVAVPRYASTNLSSIHFFNIEATNQADVKVTKAGDIDTAQNDFLGNSLIVNESGTELHAAWASRNSTYPNTFNIRYAKGTIDVSGNVTWGSITQLTTNSSSGLDCKNPSVVVNKSGNPVVIFDQANPAGISCRVFDGSIWAPKTVYNTGGVTYTQSNPCAVVDGNGVIHVVWHGTDASAATQPNVWYSKSTDGGINWSARVNLTNNGNARGQFRPSISIDNNNKLYVFFVGTASGTFLQIRKIIYDGTSWSPITDITNNTTNHTDNVSAMEKEKNSMIGFIWQDLQAAAV